MNDESITTDPSMKAEIFNKFFGSVFTVDNGLFPDVNNRAVDDTHTNTNNNLYSAKFVDKTRQRRWVVS